MRSHNTNHSAAHLLRTFRPCDHLLYHRTILQRRFERSLPFRCQVDRFRSGLSSAVSVQVDERPGTQIRQYHCRHPCGRRGRWARYVPDMQLPVDDFRVVLRHWPHWAFPLPQSRSGRRERCGWGERPDRSELRNWGKWRFWRKRCRRRDGRGSTPRSNSQLTADHHQWQNHHQQPANRCCPTFPTALHYHYYFPCLPSTTLFLTRH